MAYSNKALILLLLVEYNEFIDQSVNTIARKSVMEIENGETDNADYTIDEELARVEEELLVLVSSSSRKRRLDSVDDNRKRNNNRPKHYHSRKLYYMDPNTMERRPFTWEHSIWYCNYVIYPQQECRYWNSLFRKRFRMPYHAFLDLVKECKKSKYLETWNGTNSIHYYNGHRTIPMELLVLASLRYLGRGWTCDDVQEATAISAETVRTFIGQFIKFGHDELYKKYVTIPSTHEELNDSVIEYEAAGFPGCIGSSDASYIVMEKCESRLRQLHLGYKLAHTARTYNITVNHRRLILNTTFGHPARFNDKTLVLFDNLILQLKKGAYNDMYSFELMEYDNDGNVVKIKYNGCYVIVDNGYLSWSVTVPPMKSTIFRSELRFSQWLESLRKDVECAFGIMKCRWRILKYGIRFHSISKCDQTWMTCCALHNMLLFKDDLAQKWSRGVRIFPGDGNVDLNSPFAIRKLLDVNFAKRYDISGAGHGNDYDDGGLGFKVENEADDGKSEEHITVPNADKSFNVSDLSLAEFRNRLIVHFDIAFKKKMIV